MKLKSHACDFTDPFDIPKRPQPPEIKWGPVPEAICRHCGIVRLAAFNNGKFSGYEFYTNKEQLIKRNKTLKTVNPE